MSKQPPNITIKVTRTKTANAETFTKISGELSAGSEESMHKRDGVVLHGLVPIEARGEHCTNCRFLRRSDIVPGWACSLFDSVNQNEGSPPKRLRVCLADELPY